MIHTYQVPKIHIKLIPERQKIRARMSAKKKIYKPIVEQRLAYTHDVIASRRGIYLCPRLFGRSESEKTRVFFLFFFCPPSRKTTTGFGGITRRYLISPVRAVMIHYVRRLAWNRDTYSVVVGESTSAFYTDARCGRPLCVRSPAVADHNIPFGERVWSVNLCVWRALCGCPANASINCERAPPSTVTATPTRTTRPTT